MLQSFVIWWCQLLGVTSTASIEIAIGIVAAACLLAIVWIVVAFVVGTIHVFSS
jgi:hypothetical protein